MMQRSKKRKYSDRGDIFHYYLMEVNKFELLTKEQEVILAKRIKKGNMAVKKKAKTAMANSNLRLVISIANKYVYYGNSLEDLVAAGNVGLLRAVDKFDYTKKLRFSTYATWWIMQAIRRHLSDDTRTIRIPAYILQSDRSESTRSKTFVQSIDDRTVYNNTIDILSNDIDAINNIDNNDYINYMLKALDEKQLLVIKNRFGLGCKEKTLKELGNMLGVCKERVRQIETKALEELREVLA